MTIDDSQEAGSPNHAGFGPVLNVSYLHGVTVAGPPLAVPLSARVGALLAGIALAFTVLAVPAGVLALTVAQINPSLDARNAHIAQIVRTVQDAPTTDIAHLGKAIQGTLR